MIKVIHEYKIENDTDPLMTNIEESSLESGPTVTTIGIFHIAMQISERLMESFKAFD